MATINANDNRSNNPNSRILNLIPIGIDHLVNLKRDKLSSSISQQCPGHVDQHNIKHHNYHKKKLFKKTSLYSKLRRFRKDKILTKRRVIPNPYVSLHSNCVSVRSPRESNSHSLSKISLNDFCNHQIMTNIIIPKDELPHAFQLAHGDTEDENSNSTSNSEEDSSFLSSKVVCEVEKEGVDCDNASINTVVTSMPNNSIRLFSPSLGDQPNDLTMKSNEVSISSCKTNTESYDSNIGYVYYILLMQPQERQFELVHITTHQDQPSFPQEVSNILPLIAEHTDEPNFRKQKRVGICHLLLPNNDMKNVKNRSDKKNKNNKKTPNILQDQEESTYIYDHKYGDNDHGRTIVILDGDILVAIPEGYTKEYCQLAGQIIFQKNPRLLRCVHNSSKKRSNARRRKKKKKHNKKKRNTKPAPQQTKQKEILSPCGVEDFDKQVRMSSSSPTSVMIPLLVKNSNSTSKAIVEDFDKEVKMTSSSPTSILTPLIVKNGNDNSKAIVEDFDDQVRMTASSLTSVMTPLIVKNSNDNSKAIVEDFDDQVRTSSSSSTSVMTPLIVKNSNNSSEANSPVEFFTPQEKMLYTTIEHKQLQTSDDNVVSTVTINVVASPISSTDNKNSIIDELVEVVCQKPIPMYFNESRVRKNIYDEQPLPSGVLPSSSSLSRQLYVTKETIKSTGRHNYKQIQLKSQKKIMMTLLVSAGISLFQVNLKISGSFRIINDKHKNTAHLDLDGLIQVIIMLGLFSIIQANWEYIRKQYVVMFGKKRPQRLCRGLIESKSRRVPPVKIMSQ